MSRKYEYRVRMVYDYGEEFKNCTALEDWLNKMDSAGWELVAAGSIHPSREYMQTEDRWVFRRLYKK